MNLHYFLVYNPFLPKYDSLATLAPCVDSGDVSVYAQRYPKNIMYALWVTFMIIFSIFPVTMMIRSDLQNTNWIWSKYSYGTSFIDKQSYLSLSLFRTVEHSTGDDNNNSSILG